MPRSDAAALGALIAGEARTWVGTPYAHQQRRRGVGVDCAGLVIGVGLALDVMPFSEEAWAPFHRYSRVPHPTRFIRAMGEFLVPVSEWHEGAVACFQWRVGWPMHLGILDCEPGHWYLTHAYGHREFCVRHGFDETWRRRLHSLWLYPGHARALGVI